MSGPPTPEEYIAAAAAVPAGMLSDVARADLARFAAQGHSAASRLLALDDKARYDAAGPLPARNPFTPGDLLDAYRRHAQNNWPRRLSSGAARAAPRLPGTQFNLNFYLLVSRDLFRAALLRLTLSHESAAVTLSHLRAYSSDAPGGYEYSHPDAAALAAALTLLSAVLWDTLHGRPTPEVFQ